MPYGWMLNGKNAKSFFEKFSCVCVHFLVRHPSSRLLQSMWMPTCVKVVSRRRRTLFNILKVFSPFRKWLEIFKSGARSHIYTQTLNLSLLDFWSFLRSSRAESFLPLPAPVQHTPAIYIHHSRWDNIYISAIDSSLRISENSIVWRGECNSNFYRQNNNIFAVYMLAYHE